MNRTLDRLSSTSDTLPYAYRRAARLLPLLQFYPLEEPNPHIFINPVIYDENGTDRGTEGCLSVPGTMGYVNRPQKIKVKSINLEGEEIITEAEDFFARAICHEVDHLNGVLFIDREDYEEVVEEE